MLGLSLGTGIDSRLHARVGPGRIPPAPGAAAPALLAGPRLTGSGKIGSAVSVDPGVWSGSPRLALQWRRNGSPIPGGTDPIYVPVDSDDLTDLTCTITAINPAGSASAGTPSLFITHVSPGALGLPDVNYVQDFRSSGIECNFRLHRCGAEVRRHR